MTTVDKIHAATKINVEEIARNPQWLNGRSVTGTIPYGSLVIEDAVIKNATFVEFTARKSKIRNVTFENCRFIKANFYESEFENVTLKKGIITYKGDPFYDSNCSNFNYSVFKNVTMDGIKIEHPSLDGLKGEGGYLILKNMDLPKAEYTLLMIKNAHVRVDNCHVKGGALISVGSPGSIYATNSYFDQSGFAGSKADVIYAENCKFLNASLAGHGKLMVIKDSNLATNIGGENSDAIYLNNNRYLSLSGDSGTLIKGRSDTKIYIDGQNGKEAYLTILAGDAYVRNLDLAYLGANGAVDYKARPISKAHTIDLNNVTIRKGTFRWADLKGGRWQNVAIYPSINVSNAVLENVKTYNLRTPNGNPFTGATAETRIDIKPSDKPFSFPDIKVPTLEELGITDPLKQ